MGQTIKAFQRDLQNGMTLEAALTKHNLTFKEAFEMCPTERTKNARKKKNVRKNVSKYIQLQGKTYYVKKNIRGKTIGFGAFETAEDAIQVRDYLVEHGWNKVKLNQACKVLGIKQKGEQHD